MSETEEPRETLSPESVWLSLEKKEQENMQIALTPDRLSAMARSREKLNAYLNPAIGCVALGFAAALLYNVYKIDQPWIRVGQAWTLGVIAYLFATEFEHRRSRKGINEPCARFIARQHEERSSGYLRIRRRLFLLIPGIGACWLGRLSLVRGQAGDLDHFTSRFKFDGSWLFLITGVGLVLAWLGFGEAAKKAIRDRDELVRGIGT
jgi:hypothetical protein